jgi:hypothetical protein
VHCKFYIKIYKNNQDLLHHTGAIPERSRGPAGARTTKGVVEIYFAKKLILILCGGCELSFAATAFNTCERIVLITFIINQTVMISQVGSQQQEQRRSRFALAVYLFQTTHTPK